MSAAVTTQPSIPEGDKTTTSVPDHAVEETDIDLDEAGVDSLAPETKATTVVVADLDSLTRAAAPAAPATAHSNGNNHGATDKTTTTTTTTATTPGSLAWVRGLVTGSASGTSDGGLTA
eukprot:m.98162 g.98162  ORF g.98162 m.98162 type:complete len:119 (+) comp10250_c0_seq1:55-411(+)